MRERSAAGFRVWSPAQVPGGKQAPPPRQRGLDPLPAAAQVGVAAEPRRINPAAVVGLHPRSPLGHQREGRERPHQTHPRPGGGVPPEGAFQVKALRLVSPEVLLKVKAPAVLHKRVHAGGFSPAYVPVFPVARLAGPGEGHGAEGVGGERHVRPEQRSARGQREVRDFAGQVPGPLDTALRLDPNPTMPA